MSDTKYRSETLKFHIGDDDCAVCRFVEGSRTHDDMLETIRILDSNLADSEASERRLQQTVAALASQARELKIKLENRL